MSEKNYDRYAQKYSVPSYEHLFTAEDDVNVRREVSRVTLSVEYRGLGLWAVSDVFGCYDKDGNTSHEPMPSSRSEEFLKAHRFTKDEAFVVAAKALPEFAESSVAQMRIMREAAEAKRSENPVGVERYLKFFDRVLGIIEKGVAEARREFLGDGAQETTKGAEEVKA